MKRAIAALFLIIFMAMLLLGFKLRPELCAVFDKTPFGTLVLVDDLYPSFRAIPGDLEDYSFFYTDVDVAPPKLFIQHYSLSTNEFWVLPLRDVGRPSIQGDNDLCIRRVYPVAE